jgi:sugar phosphate isomerase/epimerase
MMKHLTKLGWVLCLAILTLPVYSQQKKVREVENLFFTLHNSIRGDSVYNTPIKQVNLVKQVGFAGMEINSLQDIAVFKPEFDKQNLKIGYVYFAIDLDQPHITPENKAQILTLNQSGAVLCPHLQSSKKTYASSDRKGDTVAVRLMQELAAIASEANLKVALYPHTWDWLETHDHALALIKKINRPNVGLAFNLPHYLAFTDPTEENKIKPFLKEVKPYLNMVTICGATNIQQDQKTKANMWTNLIKPLGTGSFDTEGLIKYLIVDLQYKGPIGLQAYAIKGDKVKNMRQSLNAWKQIKRKIETER